ncbi:MAG: M56 family metallopeptidase, partial [Planctomycetaceae bacterium]|nr:M56 family metallopeptidase [Planctomycetaceae bacterium]
PAAASRENTGDLRQNPSSTTNRGSQATNTSGRFWLIVLAGVYATGTIVAFTLTIRQFRRVRRIVRSAQLATPDIQERIRFHSRLLKTRPPVGLLSDDVVSPFATGVLKPCIVIPRSLFGDVENDQLDIVLAHELVHLRRRDLLVGWLEILLTNLWWFHPVIWWLRSGLRRTREECCDDSVVTAGLAAPVRYCETLVRVARFQSSSMTEPIVLGFADREHPTVTRIRRLMDGTLRRRDRLSVTALIAAIILGVVLLPGMKPRKEEVTEVNLAGAFGWTNLPFHISPEEEARCKELRQLAQGISMFRNNVAAFDQPDTRARLEAILREQPNFFYAQHLLGTWHLRNGDVEEGERLIEAALRSAPVVLKQPFRSAGGTPFSGVEIHRFSIECNRVEDRSLNPDLVLMYPVLWTNTDGEIQIPVYDTVYRIAGYSWTEGYQLEASRRLGWFRSNASTGLLPEIFAWRPYSRPRDFTRTAAESPLLREATVTRTSEIASGDHRYVLQTVSRAQRDATFVVQDGRGASIAAADNTLPELSNTAWMDHAIIDLGIPDSSQFSLEEASILDSRTKLPLERFQSGAGLKTFDSRRFHLYSLWNTLPDAVDLLLKLQNYDNGFRLILPAKVGATVQYDGTTVTIPHLIAGQHYGWSSKNGYLGEPNEVRTSSELELRFSGNMEARFSAWVVLRNGDRWNLKPHGWFSGLVSGDHVRLAAPLDEIDHFELCPYAEPVSICFEQIRLPPRNGALDEKVPDLEFPVSLNEQEVISDDLSPVQVKLQTLRGHVFNGAGGSTEGVSLQENKPENLDAANQSTVVWWTVGQLDVQSEAGFVLHADAGQIKGGNSSSLSAQARRVSVNVDRRSVPLEMLRTVRIRFSQK